MRNRSPALKNFLAFPAPSKKPCNVKCAVGDDFCFAPLRDADSYHSRGSCFVNGVAPSALMLEPRQSTMRQNGFEVRRMQ